MTTANFNAMINQTVAMGKPVSVTIESHSGTAHTPHGVQRFSEYQVSIIIERNGRTESHAVFSGKRDRMEKLAAQARKAMNL